MTAYVPGTNAGSPGNPLAPSGDTTGATDTTNLVTALAALPTRSDGFQHGTVELGAGQFYTNASITIPVCASIVGQGLRSTIIYPIVGSGVSAFVQHGPYVESFPGAGAQIDFLQTIYGGKLQGFTIDGSLAAQGAIGLDIGDAQEFQWDLRLQNWTGNVTVNDCVIPSNNSPTITRASGLPFPSSVVATMLVSGGASCTVPSGAAIASVSADHLTITLVTGTGTTSNSATPGPLTFIPASPPATSIAMWARNYNAWTEKATGFLSLFNNDNNLVVDVTTNPNDSTKHGGPSHEFWDVVVKLYLTAFTNGIVVQNGSSISSGDWRVSGNFEGSNSTITSYSAFHLTGTVPASHPSSGTSAQAAMRRFDWGMTSTLGLANNPNRFKVDTGCEMVAPGVSRYTNRDGDDSINSGATVLFPTGTLMAAANPGTSRVGNMADAWPITVTGGTAGTIYAEQTLVANQGGTQPGFKEVRIQLLAYSNTSATIPFTRSFANTPVAAYNTTGLSLTITTAHVVLSSATTITGVITLVGT